MIKLREFLSIIPGNIQVKIKDYIHGEIFAIGHVEDVIENFYSNENLIGAEIYSVWPTDGNLIIIEILTEKTAEFISFEDDNLDFVNLEIEIVVDDNKNCETIAPEENQKPENILEMIDRLMSEGMSEENAYEIVDAEFRTNW